MQIFSADAANGLGSGSPPTSLSYTGTFGSLFGTFADVPSATVNIVVADNIYPDNSGGFSVSDVPEPAAWAMMLIGVSTIGVGLRMARRKDVVACSAV